MTTTVPQSFAKFPGYVQFCMSEDPIEKPGWHILDLIAGDSLEGRFEPIGIAPPDQYSGNTRTIDGQRFHVVRRSLFLMGKPEKDFVEETMKKFDALTTQLKRTTADLNTANEEKNRDRAELNRLLRVHESLTEDLNRVRSNSALFEKHLGLIKKALGEKVINDIVNPAGTTP